MKGDGQVKDNRKPRPARELTKIFNRWKGTEGEEENRIRPQGVCFSQHMSVCQCLKIYLFVSVSHL